MLDTRRGEDTSSNPPKLSRTKDENAKKAARCQPRVDQYQRVNTVWKVIAWQSNEFLGLCRSVAGPEDMKTRDSLYPLRLDSAMDSCLVFYSLKNVIKTSEYR